MSTDADAINLDTPIQLEGESITHADATNTADTTPQDTVEISKTAQLLQQAEQSLADVPDVDVKKVAMLREAIQAGTYEVKSDVLAEKLMQFEELQ